MSNWARGVIPPSQRRTRLSVWSRERLGDSGDTNIRQFVWDHRNRLAVVKDYADYTAYQSNSPSQAVEYVHDFGNQSVRKLLDCEGNQVPDAGTVVVYYGSRIMFEFESSPPGLDRFAVQCGWGVSVQRFKWHGESACVYELHGHYC
jgi:hypothetical protein